MKEHISCNTSKEYPLLVTLIIIAVIYTVFVVSFANGGFTVFKQETSVQRVTLPTQEIHTTNDVPIVQVRQEIINNSTTVQHILPSELAGNCLQIESDTSAVYCNGKRYVLG